MEFENLLPSSFTESMDEHVIRINTFIAEQIDKGIKKYVGIQGSEREQALHLLTINLSKENIALQNKVQELTQSLATSEVQRGFAIGTLHRFQKIFEEINVNGKI